VFTGRGIIRGREGDAVDLDSGLPELQASRIRPTAGRDSGLELGNYAKVSKQRRGTRDFPAARRISSEGCREQTQEAITHCLDGGRDLTASLALEKFT
jgi:hypothetical protein